MYHTDFVDRFTALQKLPGLEKAHFLLRRGTQGQARSYCMKGDQSKAEWNSFHEKGPNFGKGANWSEYGILVEDNNNGRFDLNQLDYFVKEGYNNEQLIEEVGWGTWSRNLKGIDRRRLECKPKWENKREIILIHAEPGAGKTSWVEENFKDVYKQPVQKNMEWFDGYNGQETMVIDEFEGQMQLTNLLRVLDIYLEMLPVKGSFVWHTAKRIIVITNNHPHSWYQWQTIGYADRSNKEAALRRRFKQYGFIMAWTKLGLAKVDIDKYWPMDEKYTNRDLWVTYEPLIENVNQLIREPVNEIIIEDDEVAPIIFDHLEYYKAV